MGLSTEEIGRIAIQSLSTGEMDDSAIYLDEQELQAGETVEIDSRKVPVPWAALRVFVDLEPRANWGHRARWLFVNRDTGDIEQHDVQFPPWLRGDTTKFHLIWRGQN